MRTYVSVMSFKDILEYAIEHITEFSFHRELPDADTINEIISNTIGEEKYMKLFNMEIFYIDMDKIDKELNNAEYDMNDYNERMWHNLFIILKSIMVFHNISYIHITPVHADTMYNELRYIFDDY